MTDRTNVITVTQENLDWINKNVPGKSKQKRLEEILEVYKHFYSPGRGRTSMNVIVLNDDEFRLLETRAKREGISVNEVLVRALNSCGREA
ncbi:MAG: hypothetical protein LUQ71_10430 [Methanoregula sp.]|nr:hypothetical protein [Methanoregula sp.]